jgi:hypothetical protein
MSIIRPVAIIGVAVPLLLAGSSTAGGVSVPGCAYAWAQPGGAPVVNPTAQPPAWIFTVPTPAISDYVWSQPGCTPADNPHAQPPFSVLTGT